MICAHCKKPRAETRDFELYNKRPACVEQDFAEQTTKADRQ